MNPRLIAISGPCEGRTFFLHGERFSIGRHTENDLTLVSMEVSRRHCELRLEGRDYEIVDLGSRHGIMVNGRPVRRRRLSHSDLLTVGRSVLLYLVDDLRDSAPLPAVHDERSWTGGSTIIRKPSEMLYQDAARVESSLPDQVQVARDLHALLRAGQTLQGSLDLETVGESVLDAALDLVPAERAMVLLRAPGSDELHPVVSRVTHGDGAFAVGRSILQQVVSEGVALFFGDLEAPQGGESVSGLGAVLCVPFLDPTGDVSGAVYADSRLRTAFKERHLDLLGAVAAFASQTVHHALQMRRLHEENARLRAHQLSHDIVGESSAVAKLLEMIARVSRVETTILIRGESGTGKELAAQAVHRSSPRSEGPFVAINCATLSETLLESELFGHEKGAFTGAVQRQTGKVEAARGGTLFLDEVGELPPSIQAKLLRVLQEREFQRVGSNQSIRADVRIVAATHRDLEAAIKQGTFREDLYYRLKVITLETPPLRRRRDDIPLLAQHFIQVYGRRLGLQRVALSSAAKRCLKAYAWPGNVRELGNVIERALVLGDGDTIHPEDLPDEVLEGAVELPSSFQEALVETKKKLILRAWRDGNRDYRAAADVLGIHVNSLHRMIARLDMKELLDEGVP